MKIFRRAEYLDASSETGKILGYDASVAGYYLEYSGSYWKLDSNSGNRHLHFRCDWNATVGRWIYPSQMGSAVSVYKLISYLQMVILN